MAPTTVTTRARNMAQRNILSPLTSAAKTARHASEALCYESEWREVPPMAGAAIQQLDAALMAAQEAGGRAGVVAFTGEDWDALLEARQGLAAAVGETGAREGDWMHKVHDAARTLTAHVMNAINYTNWQDVNSDTRALITRTVD